MRQIRYIVTAIALLCTLSLWGQSYPKQMAGRMVNDFANVLSATEERAIESKLRALNDSTSTQIAVVTVKTLNGESPAQYATELGHQWGVGQKGKDNGIVILFKPKVGNSPGQIFISVGYGLEGAVPDATAKLIIENEMIPAFRQGSVAAGISRGVDVLTSLVKGEYSADKYNKEHKRGGGNVTSIVVIIFIIIALVLPRKNRGNNFTSGGSDATGSILPWVLLSMMNNGRSSGFGGGGSSGFGGGGSSFGGFGGGGFGGGGAGGSW